MRRRKLKRPLDTQAPMRIPQEQNQRWPRDFVADAFIDGRRFRILTINPRMLGADGGHLAVCRMTYNLQVSRC